jgi:hypothetical protein
MDLSETIAPRSDQQNYDDYLAGSRTVTISAVTAGNAEQPVNVELAEYPGRPFKPNKSMRRVLVMAWGADSTAYVGRRLTLVGNPAVKYGGKAVGGIEIAAMSHLDKPLNVALTETRGKKRPFTVQPLKEAPKPAQQPAQPARDWTAEADQLTGQTDALRALYMDAQAAGATPEQLAHIHAAATQKENN